MKPNTIIVASAFLSFQLLSFAIINISFCSGSTNVCCVQSEREALLRFKHDLIDPSNRLASWFGDGDCCKWAGVLCDNFTGHVLQLNLQNPHSECFTYNDVSYAEYEAEYEAYNMSILRGKINPSLLDLKDLIHLDLSYNDFEGIQIPGFLGFIKNLRYLNLSTAEFGGMIPHQLGNLSNLERLDLGQNELRVENLYWLTGLTLLDHLDLSNVNLSKASDWLLVTNSLSSLVELRLSYCQLQPSPHPNIVNFSSLTQLDLSYNQFNNNLIPSWIFEFRHLAFLSLSGNNFQGPLPNGLQNLTSLRSLELSYNHFNSSIPNWFYRLNRLEHLSLFNNSFHGEISVALGNLTSMHTLDLSLNRLKGQIPRTLGGICSLRVLRLTGVKLSQEISKILDLFSSCVFDGLESLDLGYTQITGHLTSKIGQFKNLNGLYLGSNSIVGPIPLSFSKLSTLGTVHLSSNKLNGTINEFHFQNLTNLFYFNISGNSLTLKFSSDWNPLFQLEVLGLGFCHLGPQFPLWLRSQKLLLYLDISGSGIKDILPSWFGEFISQFSFFNISHNQIYGKIPSTVEATHLLSLDMNSNNLSGPLPIISSKMQVLDLSRNSFSGPMSHFLCYEMNESKRMQTLNLRDNLLSGKIPDCWMSWQHLILLNLGNNKFTGNLPTSIGALSSLQSLHLHKNSLFGTTLLSLRNCTQLVVLDISENEFTGNIPTWIGESFSRMVILNLRGDNFHGVIPLKICRLVSIQILELAYNNLSGTIPRCINNFSAMVNVKASVGNYIQYLIEMYSSSGFNAYSIFLENELLMMKGQADEYSRILNLVRSIDLSNNNFSGDIPMEVTTLKELQSLNLSYNSFTGRIPENIGDMNSLESIDFSMNQLSGKIPLSISNLSFLNHLNLSSNNLVERIPSSTQLQSFDASCFLGNKLCGSPLPNECTVPVPDHGNNGSTGNEAEVDWFFVSMVLGFVVGFCGVIGPLLVNRRWRYSYYQFLDGVKHKFHNVLQKCF